MAATFWPSHHPFCLPRLNPQLLDDRPPFLGIGLHQRAERLRCLLAGRKNLAPEFDDSRAHRWIGQRLNGGSIEPADYFPWRSPRREETDPLVVGQRRQSHLGEG